MRRQPLLLLRIIDPVVLDRPPDGAVSIGRLDGADFDALGLDAGDAPAPEWLGSTRGHAE